MGSSSSRPSEPIRLVPQDPPLGVFYEFCVAGPVTMVLAEQLMTWSGNDFEVADDNGVPVIVCSGRAFSMSGRKVITDTSGKDLFHLENKMFSWSSTVMASNSQGQLLFEVKRDHSSMFGTNLNAIFHDPHTGRDIVLALAGHWTGREALITVGEGGPPIAQIQRNYSGRDFFGAQTYSVSVAPGVDLALIAAVCICFDSAIDRQRRARTNNSMRTTGSMNRF